MVTLYSAQLTGLDATIISVEADLSPGLHIFSIVGLADKEVQESRERIGAAIRNIGAKPPHKKSERLIVNLAPADIKKEGPAFDLPIALGFLLASGQARFQPEGKLFVGELGLDGAIKPAAGILAMAIAGRLAGFKTFYLPPGNGQEAALVEGLEIKEAPSITSLLDDLEGRRGLAPLETRFLTGLETGRYAGTDMASREAAGEIDFSLIRGQEQAKRALEIAAAGGHNILMQGPPGTGKTILARALALILPPMTNDEIIEVTKIYSAAGLLKERGRPVVLRPFRSPHHSASAIAVIGGGSTIRPGEVTLAHRGVMFLDELPEFQPHVLESLRQPLEDRVISVARASGSVKFPADFMFVAAMNPCPCGNLSNPKQECICSPGAIAKYKRRISGPLMDRIDLHIEVGGVEAEKLEGADPAAEAQTKAVRQRVAAARDRQRERFSGSGAVMTNSAMTLRQMKQYCRLGEKERETLRRAYEQFSMSARSYYRAIKVSRTIADLAGSEEIGNGHVLEALQYRPKQEI